MFINLFIALIIFISFFVHFYPTGPDYWWTKWSMLTFALTLFFVRVLWTRVNWFLALLWGCGAMYSVYIFSWFTNVYKDLPGPDFIVIAYYACIVFICFLLFGGLIAFIKEKEIASLKSAFMFLCVADSVFVIVQLLLGYHYVNRGGMFGNGSINASFIAFTFPLVVNGVLGNFRRLNKFFSGICLLLLVLPPVAIFASKTSVPVGVLAIALASYAFLRIQQLKIRVAVFSVCFLAVFVAGYFANITIDPDQGLFSDANRGALYSINLSDWLDRDRIWTGDGPGTFPIFGIKSQIAHKYMVNNWAIWLHSDWLQILVETGVVGLGLSLLLFFVMLFRLSTKPELQAAVLSFGGAMVFSYPVHYPIHALFAVYLIVEAFYKRSDMPIRTQ